MRIRNFQQLKIFHPRNHSIWICLFLVLITLALYGQVSRHEFLNFDDHRYLGSVAKYQHRAFMEGVQRSFSFTGFSFWAPMTWLSYTLDVRLYGMTPKYHLLTNVYMHIVNCLLLFWVLKNMTGALWQSAMVAALFAVHPINAESVAWVSERKNVLSTCFWMLTLLAYHRYTTKPFLTTYLTTLIVFVLGLMTKPMLVTLPFVFLLLDFWPLNRLRLGRTRSNPGSLDDPAPAIAPGRANVHVLLEKIPFLILSVISIKISLLSFKEPPISFEVVPLVLRIANGFVSYLSYIGKLIWPDHLAAYYPYPDQIGAWHTIGAIVAVATITGLILWKMRRFPYLAVGWLWFTGTLVPVSGLIQTGLWPALADRYAYVPQIGIFMMVVWGIAELVGRWRIGYALVRVTAVTVVMVLAAVAWNQIGYWKNSIVLFERMLKVTDGNYVAHFGLGVSLMAEKRPAAAVYHFTEAVRLNPNFAEARNSLGSVMMSQGKVKAAMTHFRQAQQLKPTYADAYNNLGLALVRQGRLAEAILNFKQAARLRQDATDARRNLILTKAIYSEITRSIEGLRQALGVRFEPPQLDTKLARLRTAKKGLIRAVRRYERSIARHPGRHRSAGIRIPALDEVGNEYEALRPVLERLAASPPVNADVYYHMACLTARQDAANAAIEWLRKALNSGFDDWDIMETDADLDVIRTSSEYQDLGRKFKPQPGKSG